MTLVAEPDDVVLLPGPWRHRTVSAGGMRFHVAEAGEGPLVLLLHGFPQFWWTWRHQLPAFAAAGFRVAAVDLRGYGASDKPPRGYDLPTLADDVAGLVRALGEANACVVGHGWGGLGAWTAAVTHAKTVNRLVAVSAPHPLRFRAAIGRVPHNLRALPHELGFQLPWLGERRLTANDAAGVRRMLREWSRAGWPDEGTAARYAAAIRVPHAAHSALEYHRWLGRSLFLRPDGIRFVRALRRTPVRVPTLVLHGARDPIVHPQTAAASAAYVEAPYRWRLLDGAGHFPHEESPDAVNRVILSWLRDEEPDR
ncbi:MAG: alpha/beta hydrolase [Streptosporangiales bacterium]|nr:alpha/beta hydrolase [Streptosporangiales bacterium]